MRGRFRYILINMNKKHFGKAQYKQGLAPLIWVIIAAFVLGGGYWLYTELTYRTDEDMYVPAAQDTVTGGLEAETADWKTYTNEKYGFEFQYPSSWMVQEGLEHTGVVMGIYNPGTPEEPEKTGVSAINIAYVSNPSGLTGRAWFEANVFKTERQIIGEPVVDGVPALKTLETGMNEVNVVYAGKGHSLFSISMIANQTYNDVFEHVLSTFKFTK